MRTAADGHMVLGFRYSLTFTDLHPGHARHRMPGGSFYSCGRSRFLFFLCYFVLFRVGCFCVCLSKLYVLPRLLLWERVDSGSAAITPILGQEIYGKRTCAFLFLAGFSRPRLNGCNSSSSDNVIYQLVCVATVWCNIL